MTGKRTQRLSKTLQLAGVASRRASESLIAEGHVRVNGKRARMPQMSVRLGVDAIEIDGRSIRSAEKKVYFILNKPKGFVCSNRRIGKQKIISELFDGETSCLFYVGRLDKDTEGLLLVTNDGDFAQKVIHPSSGLKKEYLAKTDHEITHEHLLTISQGMRIEGDWVRPVRVTKVRKGTVKIILSQGKKHEARLLLEQAGLRVFSLKRTRIGDLHLGTLPVGKWRLLTEQERQCLV